MTCHPRIAGLVAGFLRQQLNSGPVVVADLEAVARTAGLLGEGQRITDAKAFKKGKKSVGVKSIRKGFGAGGEWAWALSEQEPAATVTEPPGQQLAEPAKTGDTYVEVRKDVLLKEEPGRAPADLRGHRIPSSWIDGVARLKYDRPFADIPKHRWARFLDDTRNFMASDKNWAGRAAAFGWDALALFGCHRT